MRERPYVVYINRGYVRPLRYWPRPKTAPAYWVVKYYATVRGAKAAATRELNGPAGAGIFFAEVRNGDTDQVVCFKEGRLGEWKAGAEY